MLANGQIGVTLLVSSFLIGYFSLDFPTSVRTRYFPVTYSRSLLGLDDVDIPPCGSWIPSGPHNIDIPNLCNPLGTCHIQIAFGVSEGLWSCRSFRFGNMCFTASITRYPDALLPEAYFVVRIITHSLGIWNRFMYSMVWWSMSFLSELLVVPIVDVYGLLT